MEAGKEGVDALFDDGLQTADACGGEEGVHGGAAEFVMIVLDGADGAFVGGELLGVESPAVSSQASAVELREELRVVDVYLLGVDADDGPVFLVELLHLEDVLPAADDVKVKLIPPRQRCEPRTGDVRDRTEVEAPYCPVDGIRRQKTN